MVSAGNPLVLELGAGIFVRAAGEWHHPNSTASAFPGCGPWTSMAHGRQLWDRGWRRLHCHSARLDDLYLANKITLCDCGDEATDFGRKSNRTRPCEFQLTQFQLS